MKAYGRMELTMFKVLARFRLLPLWWSAAEDWSKGAHRAQPLFLNEVATDAAYELTS